MAPELFDKTKVSEVGIESDIWSLGCILIEIFSNKRPWAYINSQKVSNVYYEILRQKPVPIPEVIHANVVPIIQDC
jgi:serine/threonine protein kinase